MAENVQKSFLVRLVDYNDESKYPTLIKSFWVESITEMLKLFLTLKETETSIEIDDDKNAIVKEVTIKCGDHETLTCLNVYVDVFDYA